MGRSQISTTSIFQRPYGKLTVYGLVAGIGHPRAFVGASLPTVEGVNWPIVEFLDALARLQPSCAELRDALDQGGQLCGHMRLCLLSLDEQGGDRSLFS
jgi:hypothetical protein